MSMRTVFAGVLVLMLGSVPALAQDRDSSLADIRQELTLLWGQIQGLKQELNTNGAASGVASTGTSLERVTAIESELQRLTAKTEELEFRIDAIVRDATNQIGDLEFRLCELEEACDIANLADTPTLGGPLPEGLTSSVVAAPEPAPGPQLAVGEEADFARAKDALGAGDYQAAADQFAAFNTSYPGSPLAAAADLGRGEALENLGDTREAAKAYLNSFTLDQTGATAPVALTKLGSSLGVLGKQAEACVTLGEVAKRYPAAIDAAQEAAAAMTSLGCS